MFSVHKSTQFSSNPGKVHFEVLLHLLGYIRGNKNLGLRYYAKIEYALLSKLLIQANIKTDNKFMVLSDSTWQYCTYTGISTGSFIVFDQSGAIDHFTHIPVPFSQSCDESEYNVAWTLLMDLEKFRMLNIEFLNKDPDVVP